MESRLLDFIIAAEQPAVATLVVQATTAAAAISSVIYVVTSDKRRRGQAALSVSVEGDERTYFVVANLGPAEASEVFVALESDNPRFVDAGQAWEEEDHVPIERLGPGGHYVLLLPRRIPQTDPRFRVTLTWHDPYSQRRRWYLRRGREPNRTSYDLTQLGPGGMTLAEVRHQARMHAIWTS
jgi:hypothetical protein